MVGEFMVVGLGRFGRTVARQLAQHGQVVLAVDANQEHVQAVSADVDAAACADATDEVALRELHPERFSCVVVAIGGRALEASILATTLLRQAGVPRIIARAASELHARVLRAVGADEIVNPEAEIGARLAHRLVYPNVLEQMELGEDADLAELTVPASFAGKSLIDLDLRRRYGVSVVAIRRGEKVRATLDGTERLESGEVMVAIGTRAAVRKIASLA